MTDAAATPRPAHAAGRPTRDQASALADHIVDAATRLITKNGYQATSIDAIAREAGVAKRTLYSRFAAKEDLLVAVLRRLVNDVVPALRVDEQRAPLKERLEAFGADLLDCSSGPTATAWRRLIMAELVHVPDLAALVRRETVDIIDGFVGALLQDAVNRGELPAIDIPFAARSYRALLCAPVQDPTVCAGDVPSGHVQDAVAFFLRGCGCGPDDGSPRRPTVTAVCRSAERTAVMSSEGSSP
jgi:AcrR family transcriptional regulator